jgi:hypothetical protein
MSDDARRTRLTTKGLVLFVMAIAVMVGAGLAFAYKMAEFAMTIVEDDVSGFGAVAVATYLCGMLPLLLLTLWAVLSGRFRDVERPKYRMFELDEEIERGGELRLEESRA